MASRHGPGRVGQCFPPLCLAWIDTIVQHSKPRPYQTKVQ